MSKSYKDEEKQEEPIDMKMDDAETSYQEIQDPESEDEDFQKVVEHFQKLLEANPPDPEQIARDQKFQALNVELEELQSKITNLEMLQSEVELNSELCVVVDRASALTTKLRDINQTQNKELVQLNRNDKLHLDVIAHQAG
jgi:hypothetical protein